ncbi:MAG: transporter [Ignavibacteria bacterium]
MHHWEFYVSSHSAHDDAGWSGTLPHFEVNYGVIDNVQLHAIAPMAYNFPGQGANTYSFGDMELGIKYRFIQEGKSVPMIGIFPLVEVPTGSQSRGLGNGKAQFYLPVWLQKSFGKWQTYGGSGYWINPGTKKKNWWFAGWQLSRQVTEKLNIGVELYHSTASDVNSENESRFNIGAVYDFSEKHHLLFSAGRGFNGPVKAQMYIGYQLTIGPKEG